MNRSSVKSWIALAIISVSLSASLVGCKQGLGERCQVSADCADGLSCSQSEPRTCGGSNASQLDANLPDFLDAQFEDAPIDAPVDAAIDAPDDAPDDAIDAPEAL